MFVLVYIFTVFHSIPFLGSLSGQLFNREHKLAIQRLIPELLLSTPKLSSMTPHYNSSNWAKPKHFMDYPAYSQVSIMIFLLLLTSQLKQIESSFQSPQSQNVAEVKSKARQGPHPQLHMLSPKFQSTSPSTFLNKTKCRVGRAEGAHWNFLKCLLLILDKFSRSSQNAFWSTAGRLEGHYIGIRNAGTELPPHLGVIMRKGWGEGLHLFEP